VRPAANRTYNASSASLAASSRKPSFAPSPGKAELTELVVAYMPLLTPCPSLLPLARPF
jgi:hypothetical protein